MLGKPWFLSIVSGVIAALLYFTMHSKDAVPRGQDAPQLARKKQYRYALVFVVVTFLVYGSFMTAVSAGECRLPIDDIEIQTGGAPPF